MQRYSKEANRLYGVIDRRLAESKFIACDEYTIADMAIMPWLRFPERQGVDIAEYPQVQEWSRRHRRAAGGAARPRGAGRAAQAADGRQGEGDAVRRGAVSEEVDFIDVAYGVLSTLAYEQRRLRALRANRVLRADEKRIRSENAVMIKSNSS